MNVCHHCGADLAADQPIIINDFSMLSPMSNLGWQGQSVKLTHSERIVVWSIMKAFPKPISHDALLNRLDSETEGNVVDVYLSRIRKKLRAIEAPIPFENRRSAHVGRRAICWVL